MHDVAAADAGGALGRLEDAAEHADDGGFAGAVRAEETEDRAALDGEADVIDGGEVAEAFRQPVALDHHVTPFGHRSKSRMTRS